MNTHPDTVTVINSSYLPAGAQLNKLKPDELIQKGDYITASINDPGLGLIPVHARYLDQPASSATSLIVYRHIKPRRMNQLLSDILSLLIASGILVLVFRIINHITK